MTLTAATFLFFAMGYLLLGLLIGGGILRIAIQLHNRFAVAMRYDGFISEPSLATATGLVLALSLILLIFSALIQIYLQAAGLAMMLIARIGAGVCLVGLSVTVMAWIVSVALQVPWKRALVVSCIYSGINLTIAMTIIGTFAFVTIFQKSQMPRFAMGKTAKRA